MTFNGCMKTVNELLVSNRIYTLFKKNVPVAPHCFIKMFHFTIESRYLKILLGAWTKNWVKAISIHLTRKTLPPFKLNTTYPQEKSNHSKNHAYLTDSQYSTYLLKTYSLLQHLSQSGHLQACKMSDFFFWSIFLVSSPAGIYLFKVNNRKLEQGVKYVQS